MDGEGYPLPRPGAMLEPAEERADVVDQESGEATGRKVVVLRKIQPNTSPPRPHYSFASHMLHDDPCHYPQTQPSPNTSRRVTLHHELPSMLPLCKEETACPDYLYGLHDKQETDSIKTMARVPFRVPQAGPKVRRSPSEKTVTISIWREFCRGPLVYEDADASWEDVKDTCLLWPHLQSLFGDNRYVVPLSCVWLVRALLLMLKVFVPWLGLQLAYFHLLHVHIKIHLTGEKRGVQPVFIGAACQGPIIYSIRHLWCPYCRHNKQCKNTLRYFDSLLRERQSMSAR
ncbi:hypothetical protein GWK47_053417 [Chionoecetes opilio]|uniref:Uncharacterized protein n=1 Tax=Chionoecetes opilio TaxID=41210 RepID=A0A8J4Y803_CHIOP|nr:hypothetical protein GWK47_053417 [Chionoecetes opilio]